MADSPWLDDTCSLVDAFRSGDRSPTEELEASLAAIEASDLNAFSFVDADGARERAANADPSLPFGGVPIGVKELDYVEGWPATEACLVFKDRVATYTGTMVQRLIDAGANPVGLCTASEFGGLNVSITKLNGVTGNGWDRTRSAGGSSGGSSAAVAGGLVTIATGGDGGGSIRIPAGFNGLLGMKGTAGRIPRGPKTEIAPLTVVLGCQARSVRDVARWYDVCNGHDPRDPYSLPRVDGWERDLGSRELKGKKAVIAPDLGSAVVRPAVAEMITEAGTALAEDVGLELVDVPVKLPGLGVEWAMANLSQLLRTLGDHYPDCEPDLTMEMAFGLRMASEMYDLEMAARVEDQRIEANETMADLFEEVDFVIAATNPDVAGPAETALVLEVDGRQVGAENAGALTIPANIVGNPAVSIPVGTLPPVTEDGTEGTELPVGMQIIGRHHEDGLLLDLARAVERERPWPVTGPGAPH